MLAALPFIVSNVGGWNTIVSKVPSAQWDPFKCGYLTLVNLIFMYIITFITGAEMASRALASRDEKTTLKGSLLSALFMGVYSFIPALIGLVALSVYPNINPGDAYAKVMLGYAPEVVAGLALGAILATTMSSADSDMLGAASIFAIDIWKKYIRKNASDKEALLVTRIGIVLIGVLAALAALTRFDITTINTFAFMLRSAGPFAPFAFGILMRYVTKEVGIISIFAGNIAGVYWRLIGQPYGIGDVVVGAFVSVTAFLATVGISKKLGKPPAPSITERS